MKKLISTFASLMMSLVSGLKTITPQKNVGILDATMMIENNQDIIQNIQTRSQPLPIYPEALDVLKSLPQRPHIWFNSLL